MKDALPLYLVLLEFSIWVRSLQNMIDSNLTPSSESLPVEGVCPLLLESALWW